MPVVVSDDCWQFSEVWLPLAVLADEPLVVLAEELLPADAVAWVPVGDCAELPLDDGSQVWASKFLALGVVLAVKSRASS